MTRKPARRRLTTGSDGLDAYGVFEPLGPEAFARDYLFQAPVHIRGRPDRFTDLLDRQALEDALGRIHEKNLPVSFFAYVRAGREEHQFDCTADQVLPLYRIGATVCMTGMQVAVPRLRELVTRVKAQLNYTGVVDTRVYYSPDGQGFDTHFDAREAITLQVEGEKRWRYSAAPAVAYPRATAKGSRRGGEVRFDYLGGSYHLPADLFAPPRARSFHEVVLRPGDVLALPPGTWHQASAIGRSLAINLAFSYPRGRLPFFELLERAAETHLTGVAGWRALPPATVSSERPGVPDEVADFFSTRLAELRELLDRLDPKGPELAHAWRQAVCASAQKTGAGPTARRAAAERHPIRQDDVFHAPWPGLLKYGHGIDATGRRAFLLYCADPPLEVPFDENGVPFLRRLSKVRRFRAGDCVRWAGPDGRLAWRDVKSFLESLTDVGILRRADAT